MDNAIYPARPAAFTNTATGKAVLGVAATGLIALAAHVSVPLPFSPVPLTLQTFAVLLIGMALGPVAGTASMLLYLAEGAAGLPVFSPHGMGGTAQLFGPTGGFLFSYPLAAAAAGWLVRNVRGIPSAFLRATAAGTIASIVFFALGAAWLAALMHLDAAAAWHLAVAPFLPGEVVKVAAAALAYSALNRSTRIPEGLSAQ